MTISMFIQFPGYFLSTSHCKQIYLTHLYLPHCVYKTISVCNLMFSYRFVQFGADQDCHCGSSNCRKRVGASKLVDTIVFNNGNSGSSQDQYDMKKRKTTSDNCIGEIIRLWDRRDKMYALTTSNPFEEVRRPFYLFYSVSDPF